MDTAPIIVDAHVFQFHKGAIRTDSSACYLLFCIDFNSIKVRLEPVCHAIRPMSVRFQFHKGAIRTSVKFVCMLLTNLNFNSIKVRLELIEVVKNIKK